MRPCLVLLTASFLFAQPVIKIAGPELRYGDPFDCAKPSAKNWIVTVHLTTKAETILFDRPIEGICVFEQAQLSLKGDRLYLIVPTYATSGTLAIVQLPSQTITTVPGVNSVNVIESGPRRGDLIYQKRMLKDYAAYPLFHAHPDGKPIREISEEMFPGSTPILNNYLRKIGGTITVNNKQLPPRP